MPFTFAHPAAIIPLHKRFPRHLSLTGLVAGAIVPDFEYFTKAINATAVSHTFKGIFLYDLPVAFIISLLFLFIIREPLLKALPSPFDRWFSPQGGRKFYLTDLIDPRKLALFTLSVLLGLMTHLLWDSFTHGNSFIVRKIPIFHYPLKLGEYRVSLYRFLQHFSSLTGFAILFLAIPTYRTAGVKGFSPQKGGEKILYFLTWGAGTLLFTSINLYIEYFWMSYHLDLWKLVSYSISGFLLSLLVTSLIFRFRWALKVREQFFYD